MNVSGLSCNSFIYSHFDTAEVLGFSCRGCSVLFEHDFSRGVNFCIILLRMIYFLCKIL